MRMGTQFLPHRGRGTACGGGAVAGRLSDVSESGHYPSVTPLARHLPGAGRNFL